MGDGDLSDIAKRDAVEVHILRNAGLLRNGLRWIKYEDARDGYARIAGNLELSYVSRNHETWTAFSPTTGLEFSLPAGTPIYHTPDGLDVIAIVGR
jgi:hypothetical protein